VEEHSLVYDSNANIVTNGQTFGGQQFNANRAVTSIPEVQDPQSLTPFQQSQSVRFVFTNTSDFVIGFGRAGGGIRQQFAGYTNIGVNVC